MADIVRADDPACIDRAARLLAAGELVCYPTDTVYGVGALASNDAAVRRLYAVKGRDPRNPMPLLLGDPEAAQWVAEVTPTARALMRRFWPGPLTIVMTKAPSFRSLALAGEDTVALRVPDLDILREIIRAVGEPITGTSANRSGARPPRFAAEAALQLGDMVALVIDGGAARLGRESTIVDITRDPPVVLREGPVSREELASALGRPVA
jgi:L-threonylcarbamoyladenylate synthase